MAHNRSSWLGDNNAGRYRNTSNSAFDPEKQRNSYDSDEAPALVPADHPILSQSSHRPKNYALRYHVPRRRFTRIFTCGITSILVLLGLYLVGSSYRNEAEIRLGIKEAPPPPPPPHAWEHFPLLQRYYGGIRSLVRKEDNVPEFPAANAEPEIQQKAFQQKLDEDVIHPPTEGGFQKRDEADKRIPDGIRFDPYTANDPDYEEKVTCSLNQSNKAEIPQLLAYPGLPKGFPQPAYGCHDLIGLRNDICFERYGRLGPYGFGYSRGFGGSSAGLDGEKEGAKAVWDNQLEVDYRELRWADVQGACMEANKHRFLPVSDKTDHCFASMHPGGRATASVKAGPDRDKQEATEDMTGPNGKRLVPRTAVIIRTWNDYNYDPEDLFYLRALMSELSLQSGTEYVVHFLIHVKDNNNPIFSGDEVYQKVLDNALPEEFHGMGILWSEKQMELIYPGLHESNYRDLPVHGVYRSTYLPLQFFAHQHPEYDFFWHWEMDARYTGHFHHLFDKLSKWAKKQPRKGLWERNSRFYVPNEHGSWENFTQVVREQSEKGVKGDSGLPPPPIWGPMRLRGNSGELLDTVEPENDPKPPTTYEEDNYEWGVGEEADFITLNPLFDPHLTDWILAEDVTGFNTVDGFPPRRTAIITASRLSRRLLEIMHKETVWKHHTMFSEMWPGSCALHHGLKAVYAPHPVYVERNWPTSYLAAVFNNGAHGASGGNRLSTFSDERQHNFIGTTWYYHAAFSPKLWKRWLGYKVEGEGGEEWEMSESDVSNGGGEGQGEGRMCLPAMLLHPVKQVDLIYERKLGE